MSNKRDLALAYSLKRKSLIKQQQPEPFAQSLEAFDDSEPLEAWEDLPEDVPQEAVAETPEGRVGRIMRNFRLSQLGDKSDD